MYTISRIDTTSQSVLMVSRRVDVYQCASVCGVQMKYTRVRNSNQSNEWHCCSHLYSYLLLDGAMLTRILSDPLNPTQQLNTIPPIESNPIPHKISHTSIQLEIKVEIKISCGGSELPGIPAFAPCLGTLGRLVLQCARWRAREGCTKRADAHVLLLLVARSILAPPIHPICPLPLSPAETIRCTAYLLYYHPCSVRVCVPLYPCFYLRARESHAAFHDRERQVDISISLSLAIHTNSRVAHSSINRSLVGSNAQLVMSQPYYRYNHYKYSSSHTKNEKDNENHE